MFALFSLIPFINDTLFVLSSDIFSLRYENVDITLLSSTSLSVT